MTNAMARGQMIFQDENVHVQHKLADGKTKSTRAATKKDVLGFGSRKALNDITNKSCLHPDTSSRRKNVVKEEFNIAEEKFLHDHRKCIEEQQNLKDAFYLDLVLPGHDSRPNDENPQPDEENTDVKSPCGYEDPEAITMSEFSDWLKSSSLWVSPPSSPMHWDSLPASRLSWNFDTVEFKLKEEDENSIWI